MSDLLATHGLQFSCSACGCTVHFSPLEQGETPFHCEQCGYEYAFSQTLAHQLKLFQDLCLQIHRSQEILGNSSIAIDLEDKQLKVPYNLLLTRLSSVISLEIDGKVCELTFRVEPGVDLEVI